MQFDIYVHLTVNYFFDHKSAETDRATLKCGGDGDKELHCAKSGCADDNSKRLLHPEYNAFTQKLGEMADNYVNLISIVLASNRRAGVVLRATMNQLFDEEVTGPSGSDIYGGGYKRKRGTLNSSESDSDEA
ncbi:hypothetical protein ACFE04_014874 [Oxalis oulophora]